MENIGGTSDIQFWPSILPQNRRAPETARGTSGDVFVASRASHSAVGLVEAGPTAMRPIVVVHTNLSFLSLIAARTVIAFLWTSCPAVLVVLSLSPEPRTPPSSAPGESLATGERPTRLVAVSALDSARPSLLREGSLVTDGSGPATSG